MLGLSTTSTWLFAGLGVLLGSACRSANQVTIEVWTDLPCSRVTETSISIGTSDAVLTDHCQDGFIGSLVAVPGDVPDGRDVPVRVVMGIDGAAVADCGGSSECLQVEESLVFESYHSSWLRIDVTSDDVLSQTPPDQAGFGDAGPQGPAALASCAQPTTHGAYGPSELVQGRRLADWAADYLEWTHSMPYDQAHPALGGACQTNQVPEGPVWFLELPRYLSLPLRAAQRRRCDVPAGRDLLVPLGLSISYCVEEVCDYDALSRLASEQADKLTSQIWLEVDGVSLCVPNSYYTELPPVPLDASPLPLGCLSGGCPSDDINGASSVGTFMMLRALTPGVHEVAYGLLIIENQTGAPIGSSGVSYEIVVQAE